MPEPADYLNTPTDELLRQYVTSLVNPASPVASSIRLILETRNAAGQAMQAHALTAATAALVSMTGRLATATWALVVLTFVMAAASIAPLILRCAR